jgi:hypothetical protein
MVDCILRSVSWMIIENHHALIFDLTRQVNMIQKLHDVLLGGLVGENVLEVVPFVGYAPNHSDGTPSVLVQGHINQLVLPHPEPSHLLPKVGGGFVHVDNLPIFSLELEQLGEEFNLLTHELPRRGYLPVELEGGIAPDNAVLDVDSSHQGLRDVDQFARVDVELLGPLLQ